MHRQLILILCLLLVGEPVRAQRLIEANGGGADEWKFVVNVVPTPNLFHSFNLNSGTGTTVTADAGGDTGTLTGAATWVEDPASSGKYAMVPGGGTMTAGANHDGLNEFTVSIWANHSAESTTNGTYIGKTGGSVQQISWALRQNSTDDRIELAIGDNNTTTQASDIFSTPDNSLDALIGAGWVNITASVTGCAAMACTNGKIYFNGVLQTTTLTTDVSGTRRSDGTDTMRVGGISGTGRFLTNANVDDDKLWHSQLSDTAVAQNHAVGRL